MKALANIPYTIHDEPTEDWTIEQLLQWCLLKSTTNMTSKKKELTHKLHDELEIGKKVIMDFHNSANRLSQLTHNNHVETKGKISDQVEVTKVLVQEQEILSTTDENDMDQQALKAKSIKKTTTKPSSINIDILSGPYEGASYLIKPMPRRPCYLGRSAGKKFRDRGISLPNDSEVSTTHGKFEMKSGREMYFTDVGSTNGTLFQGQTLDDNVPLQLEDGMELQVGASLLKITLRV